MQKCEEFRLEDIDRCAIIIQARMSSSRFPGKMMSVVGGLPLIEYVYRRCKYSLVNKVLVATSDDKSDDDLCYYCKKKNIPVFRGPLDNVLKRYIQAAEYLKAKFIGRVCGDTPFIDICMLDRFFNLLVRESFDYVSCRRDDCASLFYSEGVSLSAMKKTLSLTKDENNREHVTKFIIDNQDEFSVKFIDAKLNPCYIKDICLTIDLPGDLKTVGGLLDKLEDRFAFSSQDILHIIKNNRQNLYKETLA